MTVSDSNNYWDFQDVTTEHVHLRCLVAVREGDPLRECVLITVDMSENPPLCLVEDTNKQAWSVAIRKMWFETDDDPLEEVSS